MLSVILAANAALKSSRESPARGHPSPALPMTPIARSAAVLLAALLASGCAAFDPHNLLSRALPPGGSASAGPVQPPANPALGEERRLEALDFVWNTVNERYHDPKLNGVDWAAARARWGPRALAAGTDEAFWDLLDRMTGELRDSHTRVDSPGRAERIARFESVGPGFSFRPLEGRLVVTAVDRESDAWWAGVRPGMALAEVDGEPAQAVYAKALAEARDGSTAHAKHLYAARRILAGEPESKVIATFARGDGTPFTATLARRVARNPPRVAHRILPSGHGYIRLTSWHQPLQDRMVDAIEALKDAPGLVIDLRGNPGGSALMVRNVAERFFPGKEKVAFGRVTTRTGKPVTLAFDWFDLLKIEQQLEGTGTYARPVAILQNASSGSGSELFAAILQSQGRATVVGETSCGCLLAFLGYAAVPGGGKLAYSEVGFVLPDGRRIEGVGVVPDVPVPASVADLLADRDRVLEEAQGILRRKSGEHG